MNHHGAQTAVDTESLSALSCATTHVSKRLTSADTPGEPVAGVLPGALLTEFHRMHRSLNHGAIVELRNATLGERVDLLHDWAARLCTVAVMCAHAAGAARQSGGSDG